MNLEQFKKYCENNIKVQSRKNFNGDIEYIFMCKNGNKIHIKDKNKGKFTRYCNGKVTNECIQKGKNGSNSIIRKRATFAANARKWSKKK